MDSPEYNLVKHFRHDRSHTLITHTAYYVHGQNWDFKGEVRWMVVLQTTVHKHCFYQGGI